VRITLASRRRVDLPEEASKDHTVAIPGAIANKRTSHGLENVAPMKSLRAIVFQWEGSISIQRDHPANALFFRCDEVTVFRMKAVDQKSRFVACILLELFCKCLVIQLVQLGYLTARRRFLEYQPAPPEALPLIPPSKHHKAS
jgi:hypothetical protein